jgi:hypothetical protein
MSPAFYVGICFGILITILFVLAVWFWRENDR